MFPFLELSEDVRQHIVSYLGVWEFFPLTLTSRRALQDVERFSKMELCRIETEHDVDASWRDRVGLDVGEEGSIEARFSFRRSLRNAYRMHLYSFELPRMKSTSTLDVRIVLSMHPDGKHLACTVTEYHSTSVSLWNLSTKECVWQFTDRHWEVQDMVCSTGHIVSTEIFSAGRLRIWSMDGERTHDLNPHFWARYDCALAVANDLVYVMNSEGEIKVVDAAAGIVLRSMEQPWTNESFSFTRAPDLCVCDNYLLHLKGGVGLDAEDVQCDSGVHVLDTESWRVPSYLRGDFKAISVAADGGVALATRNEIQLFQLQQDGLLEHRLSFPRAFPDGCRPPMLHENHLHMTNSKLLVREGKKIHGTSLPQYRTVVEVYNAFSGVMERRLSHRTEDPEAIALDITSNATEIFVGLSFGHYNIPRGFAIRAYLH